MSDSAPLLAISGLTSGYGNTMVLRDIHLRAHRGRICCLLGRNGAGKTTLLKSILGLVDTHAGSLLFDGTELANLPAHDRAPLGIGYVPQGRRLFGELTVEENLLIGETARPDARPQRDHVYALFPKLKTRLKQKAGTLSGGEQQMLAIGRALCLDPSLLLLDEPTEGLQPSMIRLISDVIVQLREQQVAIILVEQRTDTILPIADTVTFIENGRERDTMPIQSLRDNPQLLHRYVGVGH